MPWEASSPQVLRATSQPPEGYRCFLLEGSPLEVLLAGRRLLHAGWRLLHHPLYGNFRPHQQPYRSLLWRFEEASFQAEGRLATDYWSLRLLEEALALYQNDSVISPGQAGPALREACALLDLELMRLTLEQAGWSEASPAPPDLEILDAGPVKGGSLEAGTA